MTNFDRYRVQQLIKRKRKFDNLIKVYEEDIAKLGGDKELEEILERYKLERENIKMKLNAIYGRV